MARQNSSYINWTFSCSYLLSSELRENSNNNSNNVIFKKLLCGTEPHPTYKKARKYKLKNNFLTRQDGILHAEFARESSRERH